MAKLYWSEDRESTCWQGPFETVEACKQDARESYLDLDGSIWVAPVDPDTDDDDAFWAAVAQYVLWGLDDIDERLAEEGWVDPDEPWLATNCPIEDARGELAAALRKVLPPRPEWRTVDTAKAERVEL